LRELERKMPDVRTSIQQIVDKVGWDKVRETAPDDMADLLRGSIPSFPGPLQSRGYEEVARLVCSYVEQEIEEVREENELDLNDIEKLGNEIEALLPFELSIRSIDDPDKLTFAVEHITISASRSFGPHAQYKGRNVQVDMGLESDGRVVIDVDYRGRTVSEVLALLQDSAIRSTALAVEKEAEREKAEKLELKQQMQEKYGDGDGNSKSEESFQW
jgi:hypothetical protein